jgi:hypothetical protein
MADYIDPGAVWAALQAIQGGGGGASTPNTTTGYVTDNFNAPSPTAPGAPALPPSPFTGATSSSVAGAVNSPGAPTFPTGPAVTTAVGNAAAGAGGGGSGPPGTGNGVWGNPATQDGPDAWFAKAVLAAIGNPTQLQHILDSVTGPNGPTGSLYNHYLQLIKGVMAGDQDKINEAKYYATNPSGPYGPGADNNG